MTGFTRTNSGLSNLHVFHGVDYIVYTEGGQDDRDDDGHDLFFWLSVFTHFITGKRFRFKSWGGKLNVKEIAQRISEGSVRKTIAVMDSDFDEILGNKIDHPRVLYTHGYSWENDVYHSCYRGELGSRLIQVHPVPQSIFEELQNARIVEHRRMRFLARCELIGINCGCGIIPRKKVRKLINIDSRCRSYPQICVKSVTAAIAESRQKFLRLPDDENVNVLYDGERWLMGHAFEILIFHQICVALKRSGERWKFQIEHFRTLALNIVGSLLAGFPNCDVTLFHRNQMNRLLADI